MINITDEFRKKVLDALLEARSQYTGNDGNFAQIHGINKSVFSTLKRGKIQQQLGNASWITLGRHLGVTMNDHKWNVARTDVFNTIEEDVIFCQENSKARIYVDECGIGKSFTAKYLSRTRKDCFYVDASQCKTKQTFIREIARIIGVDHHDKYNEVKENIKYYLKIMSRPIIIVDEAGDLEYTALLELKELWNATEGACGWYLMGADGLRHSIEKGIKNKKVGYRELFSRFSENYSSAVPIGRDQKMAFYQRMITQVLEANMKDKTELNAIVRKCLTANGDSNQLGGLRRAESLYILLQEQQQRLQLA
ncbi:AAA family ATPase [Mucilaginibacter sp. RCC_168]|uniref:AAA family ATPase n=1 Tax=Mucilaginibacter sp. RCC_168 TaxID=3239221 RepID=UPI003523B184